MVVKAVELGQNWPEAFKLNKTMLLLNAYVNRTVSMSTLFLLLLKHLF